MTMGLMMMMMMMLLVIIVLVVQSTCFVIDGQGHQRQARPRLGPRQRQRLAAAPTSPVGDLSGIRPRAK